MHDWRFCWGKSPLGWIKKDKYLNNVAGDFQGGIIELQGKPATEDQLRQHLVRAGEIAVEGFKLQAKACTQTAA